jgi:hypothetical protein
VLGDLEDRSLGLIEQLVGVLLGVVGAAEDLGRRLDQPAQRRFLLDDLGVVLDVGRARDAVGQRRDVGRAADLVELTGARELLLERDEVDGGAALAERDHLLEDAPVRIAEEVARVDQLRCVVERLVRNQNCAEDGFFGVEAVGKRAFGSGDVSHEIDRSRDETELRVNGIKDTRSALTRSRDRRAPPEKCLTVPELP